MGEVRQHPRRVARDQRRVDVGAGRRLGRRRGRLGQVVSRDPLDALAEVEAVAAGGSARVQR